MLLSEKACVFICPEFCNDTIIPVQYGNCYETSSALHRTKYSDYRIRRTVSYKLTNVTREGIGPIATAAHTTTWAVLYRMFFSREIYAVDDNELVIPWIPSAGGISDYTRVRPKADRAVIARSLTR